MNTIQHIRTRVFGVTQAAFAELAGVSQPTVSRWESEGIKGSEPTREEMDNIRRAARDRGLVWSDELFFVVPGEAAS
jgi:DNA-binding transcriptional regulator YiaG